MEGDGCDTGVVASKSGEGIEKAEGSFLGSPGSTAVSFGMATGTTKGRILGATNQGLEMCPVGAFKRGETWEVGSPESRLEIVVHGRCSHGPRDMLD